MAFGNRMHQQPGWRQHVCGLYYTVPYSGRLEKFHLPQVELSAHATILSTTSRTTLTQRFVNPSKEKGIREVKYTFPLYDGVSVVGFTCHVGDRAIVGVVKEKEKAKSVFNEAVSRGKTAGLLEQLDTADVFSTTVGNVPPGTDVVIKITYLGELKHDLEIDGIRFTIPNIIAPRYGRMPQAFYESTDEKVVGNSISITVDAEMPEGSFIQKILSPSHPIAVSIGTTSVQPNEQPSMSKASATLSLGNAQLGDDFVLQIVAKDTGVPTALLETHPTIPNQRALMATLVPRFALPSGKPEIVFVCDRSGSMAGQNILLAQQALQVFLKSIPVGVMFNICSFGSKHSFLWPRSVAYTQATLDEAVRHVATFNANYGGTEMFTPIKTAIEQRYKNIPLEIMMLTDGEIWDQKLLFHYLNEQVSVEKKHVRVFMLGVGAAVSHSLIEGVARAGNGFSQTVAQGEKMDAKVVRMLKGALSPHIDDYSLEVKYAAVTTPRSSSDEDDDFAIVEKVADSLQVKLDLNNNKEEGKPQPKPPISLFDPTANPDADLSSPPDSSGESRYAHLPTLPTPKIIQAPQNIPTLFAFTRTTIYLLLSPSAPQETPTSIVLRGTSAHGPLELSFPVQVLDTPDTMLHQLAARKAVAELEQGRGWLSQARDDKGELVREVWEGRFGELVEREGVRLGVEFGVAGGWCSFVAVEEEEEEGEMEVGEEKEKDGEWEWLDDEEVDIPSQSSVLPASAQANPTTGSSLFGNFGSPTPSLFGSTPVHQGTGGLFGSAASRAPSGSLFGTPAPQSSTFGGSSSLFSSAPPPQRRGGGAGMGVHHAFSSLGQRAGAGISTPQMERQQQQQTGGLFGTAQSVAQGGGLFGARTPSTSPPPSSLPMATSGTVRATHSGGLDPEDPYANVFGSASYETPQTGGLFGGIPSPTPQAGGLFGSTPHSPQTGGLFGTVTPASQTGGSVAVPSTSQVGELSNAALSTPRTGGLFGSSASPSTPSSPHPQPANANEYILTQLIRLQTFSGAWPWTTELFIAISVGEEAAEQELADIGVGDGIEEEEWVTAIVVAFFEERLEKDKGSWELVVEKARAWLVERLGEDRAREAVGRARGLA
ncbi:VIT-domain-containing protein [Massarina eburnea CBS 473.64]|uniref:VIT-domain-containing protein n=1 Tax=Massarina eburnea CBS 473.64 TaxID=1395130 RepID=A0A6A6RKH6_9PLEO|nr:VIT-domain-containing protein [Massarina eburnea CBS 473.64]